MEHLQWIYKHDASNRFRFLLGLKGQKMLAIIGANPSTATPGKPDRTVARMQKVAQKHGYDGWILFNLWPERKTHPDRLRKHLLKDIHKQNLAYLAEGLTQYPVTAIWAAWGNIIEKRPYLLRSLTDISRLEPCRKLPWLQLNTPTLHGHPRHPLYQPDSAALLPFDLPNYISNCGK